MAAKKLFSPELRQAIGTTDLEQFEVHTLSWNQLHEAKQGLSKAARKAADLQEQRGDKEYEPACSALIAGIEEIEAEMDCRKRIGDNGPRSHGGDPKRPLGEDVSVSGEGERFDTRAAEETTNVLTPEQRLADLTAWPPGSELRGLSMGRYLRSMVVGGGTGAERRALVEGTDSAGGYTVPRILSDQLIDLMRSKTVAIRAGALTVPLTSAEQYIAKVASDPVPAWRGEAQEVSESDPTFARVAFEPKSLAVIVRVSRELLEDSLNLNQELPNVIAAAMAQELDRVIFLGTGTGNEPSGLDTLAGVQTLPLAGALAGYGPLVTARKNLMAQNTQRVSAWVMHPNVEAELGGLVDTTGQPLRHPPILDRPEPLNILPSTQIPTDLGSGSNESTIYAGDFSQLAIGIRNDIRIEILKERYADTMEYGFLAYMRVDVAAIHPKAFIRITGVQL
ncbi:putative phage capsid protein [Alcanivorax marinus]|nr:putative phage capsid protein [Alloalcanivorax marinus]